MKIFGLDSDLRVARGERSAAVSRIPWRDARCESESQDAVFMTSSYGLGEAVIQGAVNPDELRLQPACSLPPSHPQARTGRVNPPADLSSREIGRTVGFLPVEASLRNRFSLSDDVEQLTRHAVAIENHNVRLMDIEWGKDGTDGGYIRSAFLERKASTVPTQYLLRVFNECDLLRPHAGLVAFRCQFAVSYFDDPAVQPSFRVRLKEAQER